VAGPLTRRAVAGAPARMRRGCGGAWGVALLAALLASPMAYAAEVALDRLGHVYEAGEPITVRAPSGARPYRLLDVRGKEVGAGSLASTRRIEVPGPGYYVLELPGSDARAALAVLPRGSSRRRAASFGVATHFAQGWETDIVPLIGAAGIGAVRDEQYWAAVEKQPGEYRFPGHLTRYMDALAKARLEPLVVLSFANPLYDDGDTPWSEGARAAFARYAVAVAERYRGHVRTLEVWNEYNGSFCKGPCRTDRPRHYAALLADTARALRAHDPTLTIVGGAAVKVPLPWFAALAQEGAGRHWDAVAVHPYRPHPEGVETDIAELRELLERAGAAAPVWVTETGRHVRGEDGRRAAASYLVRQMTLLRSAGVEHIYWYLLRDYAKFEGMGLLRGPDSPYGRYAPAPAYVAYANLIAMLDGARFVRREATDPRTRLYRFERGGEVIRVGWSADTVRLHAQVEAGAAETDFMGHRRALPAGPVELVLDEEPRYYTGSIEALVEARADRVLADSAADFALEQGTRGWQYGVRGDAGGFEPLRTRTDRWGHYWGEERARALRIERATMHPARRGKAGLAAVRRWTAPQAGAVRVQGTFHHRRGGDGVRACVLRDGEALWCETLPGERTAQARFDLETTLVPGTRLDFVVDPGPAGNVDRDATALHARILAVR
jgi:hypothetical protein